MNNNAMLANRVKVPAFDRLMYFMRKTSDYSYFLCRSPFTLHKPRANRSETLIIVMTRFDKILLDEIGGWLFIFGNGLSHYRSGISIPWESGVIPAIPSFFHNISARLCHSTVLLKAFRGVFAVV